MDMTDFVEKGRFLRADDFSGGGEVTMTIVDVFSEFMQDKKKALLRFAEHERMLVLNGINTSRLIDAYGPESENWIGRPVTLYSESLSFNGERKDGIRVKIPEGAAEKAPRSMQSMQHAYGKSSILAARDAASGPAGPSGGRILDDDIPF